MADARPEPNVQRQSGGGDATAAPRLIPGHPLAARLRELTPARVGLARAGNSLTTRDQLTLWMDHARARDAVHLPFDAEGLAAAIRRLGLESVVIASRARDRRHYLLDPGAGRRLHPGHTAGLRARAAPRGCDLALVATDGLSSTAMQAQPLPLLERLVPEIQSHGWTLAPVVVVRGGRVAIGDEVGALLGARTVIVLIGERPGLSAADSMGAYLTHDPKPGRSDAERNCVSNIRPAGLDFDSAARTLVYLIRGARALGRSGVDLKDDSVTLPHGA